jgi:hypothetical protein
MLEKMIKEDETGRSKRNIPVVIAALAELSCWNLCMNYCEDSESLPRSTYDNLIKGLTEISRLSLDVFEYTHEAAE